MVRHFTVNECTGVRFTLIPYNISSRRFYKSMKKINKNINLNPWWITGITDGDGTFSILAGNNTTKSNWAFRPVFQLRIIL